MKVAYVLFALLPISGDEQGQQLNKINTVKLS